MSRNKRWVNRPEGSTWGDFGEDDQRGRINLLTPEKLKQGIAEVKEFQPFCLSLPLDLPGGNLLNPRRFPPVWLTWAQDLMPMATEFQSRCITTAIVQESTSSDPPMAKMLAYRDRVKINPLPMPWPLGSKTWPSLVCKVEAS